jgi:AcrR family transcriptional regulator
MTTKDVAAARALLADGALTSKEVAARFQVSKATLYRHLGAGTLRRKLSGRAQLGDA